MSHKSFKITDENNKQIDIIVDENTYYIFEFYYNIFDNWQVFKILPHGRGTIDELPWVLDFLKYFNYIHKEIEYFLNKKRGA